MKRLNFKTQDPILKTGNRAPFRPRTVQFHLPSEPRPRILAWHSCRGKRMKMRTRPRRGKGRWLNRVARISTEGYRRLLHLRKIKLSEHHDWMEIKSSHGHHLHLNFHLVSDHHTGHQANETEHHHSHHHRHGHHHGHHHHHNGHMSVSSSQFPVSGHTGHSTLDTRHSTPHTGHCHDHHSSWFFQSFWLKSALNPYFYFIANHKVGNIKVAKMMPHVIHASRDGKHHRIELHSNHAELRQPPTEHSTKNPRQHSHSSMHSKIKSAELKEIVPKKIIKSEQPKCNATGRPKPEPKTGIPIPQSSATTRIKSVELHSADPQNKTTSPKQITQNLPRPRHEIKTRIAIPQEIQSGSLQTKLTSKNQKPELPKPTRQGTTSPKSGTQNSKLETEHWQPDTAKTQSPKPGTDNRTPASAHLTLDTEPRTLDTVGYIPSAIPIRIIYPKVAVGAAALPE